MLTDSQTARISDPNLQNYLERIAWKIHYRSYPMVDGEDILSQMNLAIIERAESDPTFLDQQPGYITKAAAWAARTWCRRELHGQNLQPNILDDETEDGQLMAETIAASDTDLDLTISVRDTVASLDDKLQMVAQMLMQGFKKREIAETLGVTPASVSYYVNQLRSAFAPVHAAM